MGYHLTTMQKIKLSWYLKEIISTWQNYQLSLVTGRDTLQQIMRWEKTLITGDTLNQRRNEGRHKNRKDLRTWILGSGHVGKEKIRRLAMAWLSDYALLMETWIHKHCHVICAQSNQKLMLPNLYVYKCCDSEKSSIPLTFFYSPWQYHLVQLTSGCTV